MKTVLISIKEKWWKKILSGEKELEIRKNRPKGIEYPFRVVCYVTGRGIMGAFTCDYIKKTNDYKELSERSGLEPGELFEYANGKTDTCLYGWHVKEETPVEFDQAYTANLVAYSFDGETYGATYNNTKEALKDAIVEFEEFKKHPLKRGIPNKIFVGQCEFYRPSLSNSGYDVIEAVQCQAQDEGGEWADDYLDDATKEQIEELENGLEAVFQDWIQKYNFYPNFYTIPAADVYTYDGEQLIQEGDAK